MPVKRKVGRPPKRRNTIAVKDDIQRAMNTGMSLTQLKEYIEYWIENPDPDNPMDPKMKLDYIKADLQVWEFLTKNYRMFLELEEKYGDGAKKENGSDGKVVAFSLKA